MKIARKKIEELYFNGYAWGRNNMPNDYFTCIYLPSGYIEESKMYYLNWNCKLPVLKFNVL